MSNGFPREIIGPARDAAEPNKIWSSSPTPGVNLLGFETVRIRLFSAITRITNGIGIFGPAELFTVPDSVERRIVTRIGVSMSPETQILETWWWLTIGGGPAQEFILEGSASLDGLPFKIVGGNRWTGYGQFDLPQDFRMLLHPGARLEINFGTENTSAPWCLNSYIRISGYDESKAA